MKNIGIGIGIGLIIGVVIGAVIGDIPNVGLVNTVRIGELINSLLAIIVALVLPFTLKRIFDKRKLSSNLVANDLKDLSDTLGNLMDLLGNCLAKEEVTMVDKNRIKILIKELDAKVELIEEDVHRLCKTKESTNPQLASLKSSNLALWKSLTDGNLTTDAFQINMAFYTNQLNAYKTYKRSIASVVKIVNDQA